METSNPYSPEDFSFDTSETDESSEAEHSSESADDVREQAAQMGLSPEETEQAVDDFHKLNQPEYGSAESVLGGFDEISARFEQMAETILAIDNNLENMGEIVNEFIKELIRMIEEIQDFLNKIAQETDPDEKDRLTIAMQQKIDQFGGMNFGAGSEHKNAA